MEIVTWYNILSLQAFPFSGMRRLKMDGRGHAKKFTSCSLVERHREGGRARRADYDLV